MRHLLFIAALIVILPLPILADDGLDQLEPSSVNADVLLLDPRWDAFLADIGYYWTGSGEYSFGDPRFDELEYCRGYAKRTFDGGAAFILRKCRASLTVLDSDGELPNGFYYILWSNAVEKSDSEIRTWNGHRYGSRWSYAASALPMTFLFLFPDGSKPLVGDFTSDLHGALVAATNFFDYGIASGKLVAVEGGIVGLGEGQATKQEAQSWGSIKNHVR